MSTAPVPAPTPAQAPPGAAAPAGGLTLDGDHETTGAAPHASPRLVAGWVAALGAVAVGCAAALLPVPYVVERPGPVYDTLGQVDGTDLITITGAVTYPTTGSLDLTTVRVAGGPGSPVDLVSVLVAWLHPDRVAVPVELVYPTGATAEEEEARDARDMTASQDSATVAALTELGYQVPTTLTVAATPAGSPSAGLLLAGDVVRAVDGVPATDLPALRAALDAGEPGRTVVVRVLRDGAATDVPVVTAPAPASPDDPADPADPVGRVQLGISVDVDVDDAELPVQVDIEVDRIGGPSAGLLFALGIVDRLTPGPMTGGLVIAGTGTIDSTGAVGGIGGMEQKMAAAADAGASAFLAPTANCGEVVGTEPDGLLVLGVSTLAEARAAVEALGRGERDGLPTCPRTTGATYP